MQLLYLNYNNYNNRIIKRKTTVADYQEYLLGTAIADWNPNDGVTTTIVVNQTWSDNIAPDYLVCVENNQIVSRWFITEYTRLRGKQFKATFRRDVIADYYDKVIHAPAFIEKATLEDNDPYIFNVEKGITFNQIKKSETLLKDSTECAWVVGYVPRNSFSEDTTIVGNVVTKREADYEVNGISNWEFYKFTDKAGTAQETAMYINPSSVSYNIYTYEPYGGEIYEKTKFSFNENGGIETGWVSNVSGGDWVPGASKSLSPTFYTSEPVTYGGLIKTNNKNTAANNLNTIMGAFSKEDFSIMGGYISSYSNLTSEQAITFQQLDGKIIKDTSTNLYYTISANVVNQPNTIYDVGNTGPLYTFMKERMDTLINSGFFPGEASGQEVNSGTNNTSFRFVSSGIKGTLTLTQFSAKNLKTTITKDRYHLFDAPYDMFCLPYSSDLILKSGDKTFKTSTEISLNFGVNIGLQSGTGNIYDLQLLPYCPIRNFPISKADDGTVTLDFTNYPPYNLIQPDDGISEGVIFWASESNFETTIDAPIVVTNPKIESQTDLYRICSPNYSNAFDFNAAMNGGVDYYIVECTYKPWTPYIHVYPNFKFMYGNSGFKDARGLILGGEFSLPQISSEWANYQMQNKINLNVFDKTITTLTGKNTQLYHNEAIYSLNPNIDITKSMNLMAQQYGSEAGNIIAMPIGLSKTSALTYNNKLFPFVEYYSCTDEEKDAFSLKLKYNGMTVMRISDVGISAFIKPTKSYIKAKLIRIEDLGDDAHMWKTISDELYKGIFIGG